MKSAARRRRKKRRKLKTGFKLFLLCLFSLIFLFAWKRPPRGKLPQEFISEIREKLHSGSGYSLYRLSDEFCMSYPDHEDLFWAWFAQGIYNSRRNEPEKAVQNFENALSYAGVPAELLQEIHTFLSLEYIKLKKLPEAFRETQIACNGTRNIDELAYLYYQKGYLENRMAKYTEAVQSFATALNYKPDNMLWVSIRLEEAYSRQNMREFKSASVIYREIIDKFPDFEYECSVARKSLSTLDKVRKLQDSNELEEKELELMLRDERRFLY